MHLTCNLLNLNRIFANDFRSCLNILKKYGKIIGKYYDQIKVDTVDIIETDHEIHGFVSKFDNTGKLKWLNTLSGSDYNLNINDVAFDNLNNIYICGDYNRPLTFKTGDKVDTTINDINTSFIAKYDTEGNFENVYSLGSFRLYLRSFTLDDDQNIYATGSCQSTYSYTSGSVTPAGGNDIIIVKFDRELNVKWIKLIGSSSNTISEMGRSLALDQKQEYLYVTGCFVGQADFGNGAINSDDKNIFLAKYSIDGDLKWVKKMGSWSGAASYVEIGKELIVDKDDFIYLAGDLGQYGDFDGTEISAYDNTENSNLWFDFFLAKFYSNGKLSWVTHAGNADYADKIEGIAKDNNNNVFTVGETANTAIFGDFQLDSDNSWPGFIARFKDTEEDNIDDTNTSSKYAFYIKNNIKVFPNPFNNYIYLDIPDELSPPMVFNISELNGKNVYHKKINSKEECSDLKLKTLDLKPGVYLISIKSNDYVYSYKVVKQ